MNVQEALIGVITMQLVVTLKEVTPALATVDAKAMDFLALVSSSIFFQPKRVYYTQYFPHNQISMSASVTMAAATTSAVT